MNEHVHPIFARLLDDFAATIAPPSTVVLQELCWSCGGTGGTDEGRCGTCQGRGVVEVERKLP